ncbi:HEPN domain-containing protein [Parabacteroides sp. PF5-6]|uniref:HEPN domain-containing protein n=1 Tax=Parabacteroides sp. PF5-6 TaxID=1742403 RepID=UPI002406865A|nr:HEPN domain-containing protein [Parabacteroides sp. PF5-6]MDF9831568.1 HEPN domain-containing protein [Parabacteroides sp. PF5-6]
MEKKINYWKDLSDYDMETAEVMLQNKRYLYVGFMCHQVIEKIFKAYYSKLCQQTAPYTHNLSHLARQGGFFDHFSEEQKRLIFTLEPLNIEARYPSYKEQLLKSLSDEKCRIILKETKQLKQWIEEKL